MAGLRAVVPASCLAITNEAEVWRPIHLLHVMLKGDADVGGSVVMEPNSALKHFSYGYDYARVRIDYLCSEGAQESAKKLIRSTSSGQRYLCVARSLSRVPEALQSLKL